MRQIAIVLLAILVAGAALAADPLKTDTTDYTLDQPARIQITGELTVNSPTWHRWRPDSYTELSLDCMLNFTYEYTTDPHYDMYCFNVSTSDPVEFVVDDAGFDTVLYIFCDPFDPNNSTTNGVFMDDDDGEGLFSAIMTTDGVTLTPGNDYWLVVCAYSTTYGAYSIQTSDNVALCGSVPADDTNWSSLKALFR
jgi:hypothetical protein